MRLKMASAKWRPYYPGGDKSMEEYRSKTTLILFFLWKQHYFDLTCLAIDLTDPTERVPQNNWNISKHKASKGD